MIIETPVVKGKAFLKSEWVDCNFIKLLNDSLPVIALTYTNLGNLLGHSHLVLKEHIRLEE